MASANPNFDAVAATTLANYRQTMVDNIFSGTPLLSFLSSRDRMSMKSGQKAVIPLLTGENSTVDSYSGYDTIALTPQEGISAAEFTWNQIIGSVAISGLEKGQNQEPERLSDLLKARVKQTEETIKNELNEQLYSDGSGNSGKDFDGLAKLVDATGTVGGIDQSSNAFWASYEYSTAGVRSDDQWMTAIGATSGNGGNNSPDAIFTTFALWADYNAGLAPQLRFTSTKEADARFQNLMFYNAPVFWDNDCTADVTYFLNSKYLELVGMKNNWFVTEDTIRPADKDAFYSAIKAYGALTVSHRARHGKITGQTV